jgi:hypothetical protein
MAHGVFDGVARFKSQKSPGSHSRVRQRPDLKKEMNAKLAQEPEHVSDTALKIARLTPKRRRRKKRKKK